MRGRANANFFKNAGANDFGGGAEITIAAPKRNPNVDYAAQENANANAAGNAAAGSGAPASAKAIEAALKRAQ